MATRFEVHAGDFKTGKIGWFYGKKFKLKKPKGFFYQTIKVDQVATVEIASEESVKRLGGSLGWGAAGAVLLGPLGLLAGLIGGGKGTDVTFVCEFKDGRRMLATLPAKDFTKLKASAFQ